MNNTLLLLAALVVCPGITKKVDEYTGEIHYSSPSNKIISAHKYIDKSDTTYYLYLDATGRTLTVSGSGAKIKLDNDSILEWEYASIDVNYRQSFYHYTSMVELDDEQLQMLCDNNIVSFKLYIFDGVLSKSFRKKLNEYIKCIKTQT